MKKRWLTAVSRLLCTMAIVGLILMEVPLAGLPGGSVSAAEPGSNFANLVVFVDYADSTHEHTYENTNTVNENCPAKGIGKTLELFNGDGTNNSTVNQRSLKNYISEVSYGAVRVENIFPQWKDDKIIPLQLDNNAAYYTDGTMMKQALITEVIGKLNTPDYAASLAGVTLDYWGNDGCIDNLTVVVNNRLTSGRMEVTAHKSNYGGNDKIANLEVGNYNIIPEESLYSEFYESGVIIHEFMHSLGYPDLYDGKKTAAPVGEWDIMSQQSYRVQYPLAYMRQYISGWLDLPVVTTSQAGYSLTAASEVTAGTKNQQAVILKTPYSDTEFFVVEYRRNGGSGQAYDSNLLNSGIIIYRVNTALVTNYNGAPFMVYVYRPGDTYDANGHEAASNVHIHEACLSSESGRTSYGSADLTKTLSDGAITYGDGRNSGIVIRNVGSASGSQITFDITFPEEADIDYWKTLTSGQDQEQTVTMASCMDNNGIMYYIKKDNNTGSSSFYRYHTDGWTRLGNAPSGIQYSLCTYNNSVYAFYTDGSRAVLAQWNGTGWQTVHTVNAGITGIYMAADASGIYCTYDVGSQTVYAFRYTAGGVAMLGTTVNEGESGANGQIAVGNGRPVVIYRAWRNNNAIRAKEYQNGTWVNLGNLNLSSGNAIIRANGDYFYIAASGSGGSQGYVYRLDATAANPSWNVVGGTSFTTESIGDMDMCFQGSSPYILYLGGASKKTMVKTIKNNQWVTYGATLANDIISDIHAYTYQNQMYVTYINTVNSHVYIRTNAVSDSSGLTGSGSGEITGGSGTGTIGGGTGGTGTGTIGGGTGGTGTGTIGGGTGGTGTGGIGGSTISYPDLPDGWQYVNGNWYYYSNHRPHFGWLLAGGSWYYLKEDGTMATGWLELNNTWYYLNSDGSMVTGWLKLNNTWYYLTSGGAMATGWAYVDGAWYYLNPSGAMATGWIYVGGEWYYLNPSGDMAVGWAYVNGAWYYLTSSGAMATGWVYVGGAWYYLNPSGAMATGWVHTGGAWYYLRPNGSMVTGWMRIGGTRYHFNASGAWDR